MQHGLASPFDQGPLSPLTGLTVLQIIPALDAGAAEQTTIDIAAALTEVGARALVATPGGALVSELQARGGVWVPFPADSKNPLAMANNVRKLRDLIRAERPAVVHAQSRAPGWVALGATRLTSTPFMTTFHGSSPGRHPVTLQYDSVMARGDLVLAQSHYTGDRIAQLYPWAKDRVRVVPLGIDLRKFSVGAVEVARVEGLRATWDVAPDRRIVLLAGRLTECKGQRVLIAAAALLQARGLTDTTFVLAGDSHGRSGYVDELDRLIVGAKLEGIVKRVGRCADMPAALLAASLVVVPSTRPECFGLSALEAQAMGAPVVVSNHGAAPETVLAPPDVLANRRTGWRVMPGDAAELADAIEAALALGASALDAQAMRARTHVETQFTRDRMTEATLDAYAALIEAYQPQKARARFA